MTAAEAPAWLPLLCWTTTALAALPGLMMALNLPLFRPPHVSKTPNGAVSVIVPARNEEAAIGACLQALRASTDVELEIIIVDDHSTDQTAAIVRAMAEQDPRIRLHPAPALPPGWSGKQHACHQGAAQARHPILMFMDCDVSVAPAAVAAMAGFLTASGAALVSGFPRERTETLGEALLIPLIHVLLLGYLPIAIMRRSKQVGLGAGCGQIMLADAAIYRTTRGHALIRDSWHDGLTLPRAFRRCGHLTDIFDATDLAECRMYRGLTETWRGLSKNAREGMATRTALPIWTLLLGFGLVAPFCLLPFAWNDLPWTPTALALSAAVLLLLLTRLRVARRFRQNLLSVPLLPIGVTVLLLLQWRALLRRPNSASQVWRGRTQFSR
jgi:hypothetical protein